MRRNGFWYLILLLALLLSACWDSVLEWHYQRIELPRILSSSTLVYLPAAAFQPADALMAPEHYDLAAVSTERQGSTEIYLSLCLIKTVKHRQGRCPTGTVEKNVTATLIPLPMLFATVLLFIFAAIRTRRYQQTYGPRDEDEGRPFMPLNHNEWLLILCCVSIVIMTLLALSRLEC